MDIQQMAAEFKVACRAIDKRAAEAETDLMRSAFSALLGGDTDGRDRRCARIEDVALARTKAKIEAWMRIGERHGIDRETAQSLFDKVKH